MTSNWRNHAGSPFAPEKQGATASRGMVASNHPIASAAGVEMLALGGNAIDAAVATAFTLSVVEPMMVSIFGAGLINFYHGASGQFIHIDNYTVAPSAATPDMFEPISDTWPDYMDAKDQANRFGYRAVGVAGALKAWCQLEEQYGKLGLDTVMQPAIRHAAGGFAASGYMLEFVREYRPQLDRFPASRAVFLPAGAVPSLGQHIVRGDYARTLQRIADGGPFALYGGSLGERVAADIAANGGLLTLDDLRDYCIQLREPVRGKYRGYEIVSMAPTSSGGTHIIQVLNLLEAYDIGTMGFGTAETLHLLAESLKLAFADRFKYMGDPAFVDVPLRGLTSKEYASARRTEIDPNRAQDYRAGQPRVYSGESGNTTHFTVADGDGNVVALTQTLNGAFGSCVTTPGTGMLLNNTMHLFDPHPGHANSVAPRKRMLSSMAPTMVMKDGKPFMALGTPGGTRIFAAVLQAISNVVDHGMTLQEAVEAPRIWTQGDALNVEPGIAPAVRDALAAKGHRLELTAKVAGGMNGILFDQAAGLMYGAACWRADGAPAGLSGGWARPPEAGAAMPVV